MMEGVVRRWMGTHPASIRRKSHGGHGASGESKRPNLDQDQDAHSTETIARQLLDPTVSESEEVEYRGLDLSNLSIADTDVCLGILTNVRTCWMLLSMSGSGRIWKYISGLCGRQWVKHLNGQMRPLMMHFSCMLNAEQHIIWTAKAEKRYCQFILTTRDG
jgi:hypothetical protein